MSNIHVSIAAEKLFDLGPLHVTNALFTSWVVLIFLTLVALVMRLRMKKKGAPRGLQNLIEIVIEGFYGLIESTAGSAKLARRFFAVLMTIFIFILFNNWFGLIPGVGSIGIKENEELTMNNEQIQPTTNDDERIKDKGLRIKTEETRLTTDNASEPTDQAISIENLPDNQAGRKSAIGNQKSKIENPKLIPLFRAGSADLSLTLALAIIAVVLSQYHGFRELGGKYLKKFFNLNGIHAFVGLLELVSEFSKVISFSFRLFGNVFAGEVLLTVILSLAPFIAPMPFYGLEIFVGAVQAFVFMMLSLVFFKMATVHEGH